MEQPYTISSWESYQSPFVTSQRACVLAHMERAKELDGGLFSSLVSSMALFKIRNIGGGFFLCEIGPLTDSRFSEDGNVSHIREHVTVFNLIQCSVVIILQIHP